MVSSRSIAPCAFGSDWADSKIVASHELSGTALITGASGFIGRRLRDALLERGVDVVAVRRASSPEPSAGRSVVADYADLEGLKAIVAEQKPDYVFHVAGATKGRSYGDFTRANVMPTSNLITALEEKNPGVCRFVLVSSLASYGPSQVERPHCEDDPREPIEFYGKSKLEAEQAVEASERIPWTIVRPGGVYGPGDVDYFNLFKSVAKGVNVYFGNRSRLFSAIYVDDCVRAILDAAGSEAAARRGYFLCDGHPISWQQFQELIIETSERKVRTIDLPEFLVTLAALGGELASAVDGRPRLFNLQKAKMGAQRAWTCSHEAAHRDFGYAPEVAADEGVKRTADWYRQEGWC